VTTASDKLLTEVAPHLPAPLLATLRSHLLTNELKLRLLEEKLRLQRIAKYGPGAEKLNAAQLELLELEPGVSGDEVAAEAERPPLDQSAGAEEESKPKTKRKRRPHPGRQTLPEGLPRVVTELSCPPEACVCADCGGGMAVIGHDESERLDVKPAEYFVAVTRREKRACASCQAGGVTMAPLPVTIIAKGIASDAIVIGTLIEKYSYHCPLYRQSVKLATESGVKLCRATLDGWVMQVGGALRALVQVMARELLAGDYLQADETPVGVQMHDKRGKNHPAYLWQYGRPGAGVVFDFRMGRGREGPKQFLGDFAGILQTDGYAAYEGVGGPGLVHAACWTHARRKFFDAVKLNPEDRRAIAAVAAINELFALDRGAAESGLDIAARHQLRQQEAPALLAAIGVAVEAARRDALPASKLGGAARYSQALWHKLTRFLEHPVLELSNNLAENSMRPLALGRKNWIHLGSPEAAPLIAAILSVVETCRRLDIPLRLYLAAVLPGLADRPLASLPALTPAAWWAARPR
jgi:transposase